MHELYCPSCNTPSPYNFADHLLMCPFCSATFKLDEESGHKEIYGDHYIIPNTIDPGAVKELTIEWLKRLHHRPGLVSKDFYVVDIQGFSVPLWIVSMEGHTSWKGLIQKQRRPDSLTPLGTGYLMEKGQFRRSYRWAISARSNICETWGFARLHSPAEPINVEWDGFPLDSTLSRGRLVEEDSNQKSAYDIRKFFEFKFSNGLPILGIQVSEEEALRRARNHINLYHYKLAMMNADYLVDHRTELEIAGIQLIHTPFWKVSYVYNPKTALRHFLKSEEKRIILDGYGKGVLTGEIAVQHSDKVFINSIVTGSFSAFFLILAFLWHPAFYLVSGFALTISLISAAIALKKKADFERSQLEKKEGEAQAKEAPSLNTA